MPPPKRRRLPLSIVVIRAGAVLLALAAMGVPLVEHLMDSPPEQPQEMSLEVQGLH